MYHAATFTGGSLFACLCRVTFWCESTRIGSSDDTYRSTTEVIVTNSTPFSMNLGICLAGHKGAMTCFSSSRTGLGGGFAAHDMCRSHHRAPTAARQQQQQQREPFKASRQQERGGGYSTMAARRTGRRAASGLKARGIFRQNTWHRWAERRIT